MSSPPGRFRRTLLPIAVFAGVFLVHFLRIGLFPENGAVQNEWVAVAGQVSASWLRTYLEMGSYWLGYSYAVSLAFAAAALRRYRENRMCAAGTLAVGSLTFSGVLAVGGCYLLGCCGSPMLAVYVGLLGVRFLPWEKPLVAVFTSLMILGSYGWMKSREGKAKSPSKNDCGCA